MITLKSYNRMVYGGGGANNQSNALHISTKLVQLEPGVSESD